MSSKLIFINSLDEMKSEREFYRMRGEICPKDIPQQGEEETQQEKNVVTTDYHRLDEQVSFLKIIGFS